ncbi:MAG: CarD family transcriptional regulator [Alphaproteobacteria bacterium]|nr:CarD family transcriptional regulator [Alphaproteobacteria bacterium]MBM3641171.1 CarD family transcriptional regulator [Alphaproteobacteria bacterium]
MTKRAVAAKAAKTAAEKVSAKQKAPVKTAKPAAPSKTATAKPVKIAAPVAAKELTAKQVEQRRPVTVAAAPGKTRPVAESQPKPVAKTIAPAPAAPSLATPGAPIARAPAPAVARPGVPVKAKSAATGPRPGFKLNEFIVYPAHGVGQITGVEIQEVAGFSLELFVVSFIKDKMILKVPTSKVVNVGMRKLADAAIVDKALQTLSGRARVKRTMWSRRAQEYEAKINSGDLVTIAEVVRDLYRSDTQPEQSYSERQLYEAALDRMAREIAAVRKLIDSESLKLIESFLLKGPRRGPKADGDVGDDGGDEADVDRAA